MIYSRSSVIWGEDYNILDPEKVSTFIKLPYPQVLVLAKGKSAVFAILIELAWKHFEQKKNPVKYCGSKLSRYVRRQGLKILEREKWITVDQKCGKAPVVTLRWLKLTRADSVHQPGRNPHKTRA
jgi:hypothetical protein